MRLAACLYVRNEAPDIAEWLAFHHGVGFDHVLVFDNLSTDATSAIVRQAARHASITLLPWPVRDKRAQLLAYALGRRLLRRFDRVAFLDSDEFLTPTGERGVKAVLETLADADAIAVNWAVFGSNGHADAPPGLVIERFTRRAEDAFPANRIVKSIVDPRRVRPAERACLRCPRRARTCAPTAVPSSGTGMRVRRSRPTTPPCRSATS